MRFKIGRIRFVLSFPLVCILAAAAVLDATMSMMICFAAAVMHELGHIITMRHFGTPPEEIDLTLFDIAIIDTHRSIRDRRAELIITLAGAAVNFFSAAVCFLLYLVTKNSVIFTFFSAHLTLGLFNSLPVESLDGGRALYILLSRRFMPDVSRRIVTAVSLMILIPAAVVGFCVLLQSKYNFTLLLSSLYLIAMLIF